MSMNIEINSTNVATGLGMFAATSFFGSAIATTYMGIPALTLPYAKAPESRAAKLQLAQQWNVMFDRGSKYGPLMAVSGALSWQYVAASLSRQDSFSQNLYITGAACFVGVVPFTAVFMRSSIGSLSFYATSGIFEDNAEAKGKSESRKIQPEVSVEDAFTTWTSFNMLRACLPVTGLFCVLYANLKR